MTIRSAIACAVVAVAFMSPVALARPLEAEACAKLKTDLTALDEQGVRAFLDKGPEAAKSSGREQIRQVRQYFDLLGQVRFRCPLDAPLVTLRPEPPEDPLEGVSASAPIEAGTPGITLPPGVAAATVAPLAAKAVAPKVKAAPKKAAAVPASGAPAPTSTVPTPTAPAPTAPQTAPAAAPVKAKPKPKVDDALRPAPPAAAAIPAPPAAPAAPSKAP